MRREISTVLIWAFMLAAPAYAMPISPGPQNLDQMHGSIVQRVVDQDRIEGSIKRLKGSAKEEIGKMTGNRKMQAEGAREKAAGKVQHAIGGFRDSVKEIIGK